MTRVLRQHASVQGQTKKFDYYNKLLKLLQTKYNEELLSSEYYDRIIMIFNRKSGGRSRYAKEFEGYEAELRNLLKETSSYNFRLNYHRVFALATSSHHAEAIKTSRAGLEFIESMPHLTQRERKGDFWLYQLQSYIGMQDLDGAREAAAQCASYYNLGSNSWFAFAEANFLLLMNTLQIREAHEFFTEVTTNVRYEAQSEIAREHWEVFRFYLIHALQTLPDFDPKLHPQKFNFALFERKVEEARKDKEGMNILIRLAHIIHLVESRKYDDADRAVEALDDYRRRHIQANKTPRTSLFMQLLRMMEKYSYSYKFCLANGKKTYERLKTEKFEVVDLDQEIQVLPYPWLWDRLLERMKANEELTAARYR
jgi:hypothetical protein